MEQQTQEWLDYRKNKIGASDSIVIMGLSPWTTPLQLFEEKIGFGKFIKKKNASMQRGLDLEERARNRFEEMTGLLMMPKVKEHANINWMMASLDGIDLEEKNILEIKCPGKEDHDMALQGVIPTKYFPQLQHQIEVTGLEMAYYFSFDGKDGVIIKIYRDDQYIKKMLAKELEFWDCLQSLTPPIESERDIVIRNDNFWKDTAEQFQYAQKKRKEYEQMEEDLRKTMIVLAEGRNCKGAGMQVSKIYRKGNVDYSSIPELQYIDLEKYRKPTTESWRITNG